MPNKGEIGRPLRSLYQEIIEEQCRNNVWSKEIWSQIASVICQWISRIGNVHDFPSQKWSSMLQLGPKWLHQESNWQAVAPTGAMAPEMPEGMGRHGCGDWWGWTKPTICIKEHHGTFIEPAVLIFYQHLLNETHFERFTTTWKPCHKHLVSWAC